MNRSFTFFFTDNCELQATQPIGRELERRGYAVRYSPNISEPADVGVYCHHAAKPNAQFSVISLHDLAQRHDIWPNFWQSEPWSNFDIGLLPGKSWAERWITQSHRDAANPRLGSFIVGWPKSDLIFTNQLDFNKQTASLKEKLNLPHPTTILYAPSWENDGKQADFVEKLKDLPVNLLLKQAPWSLQYRKVLRNIEEMDRIHRGMADNIHVMDREISIMYCIGISDLLVSDESSTLIEAALYEVPSVAVTDWTIPDTIPPRPACVPFDNVRKVRSADLRETVKDLISGGWDGRAAARQLRDFHFSEIGHSSSLVADLILAALRGSELPVQPLKRTTDDGTFVGQMHNRALQHWHSGNINSALDLLSQLAASAGANCWQVFNTLGEIATQMEDLRAAEAFFLQALRQSGENLMVLTNLAALYETVGKCDRAILFNGLIRKLQPMQPNVLSQQRRILGQYHAFLS